MVYAEGSWETCELGRCGPRRPWGREDGKKSRRSQINNPSRNAGGFLLRAEVGFAPGYIAGSAESPLME